MSPSPSRQRILIVDDIPANIRILGEGLKSDYDIIVAVDGEAALRRAFSAHPPDLILLDIMMPGMDGYEVCKKLKADERTKDIPVIFITARNAVEDETKGLELGAVDYIRKPFSLPIVRARIKTHLELKQKNDILEESYARLGEANRRIMDSIRYAHTIQLAILPKREEICRYVTDSFVIWKPKDVIGGDFFWFEAHQDDFLLAVIDCTGHGVPGAIMTMIAATTLDRVVHEAGCCDPAPILKELNFHVRRILHQQTSGAGSDDGMDIGLCHVNCTNRLLTYAGARISLFYAREGSVYEIEGDRQSLGYKSSDVAYTYTHHSVPFYSSTSFYITTDGLIDQIGGKKKLPFGKRRLQSFLTEHYQKPFEQQKALLTKTFENYQGDETQRDDMMIIGFCI